MSIQLQWKPRNAEMAALADAYAACKARGDVWYGVTVDSMWCGPDGAVYSWSQNSTYVLKKAKREGLTALFECRHPSRSGAGKAVVMDWSEQLLKIR